MKSRTFYKKYFFYVQSLLKKLFKNVNSKQIMAILNNYVIKFALTFPPTMLIPKLVFGSRKIFTVLIMPQCFCSMLLTSVSRSSTTLLLLESLVTVIGIFSLKIINLIKINAIHSLIVHYYYLLQYIIFIIGT